MPSKWSTNTELHKQIITSKQYPTITSNEDGYNVRGGRKGGREGGEIFAMFFSKSKAIISLGTKILFSRSEAQPIKCKISCK